MGAETFYEETYAASPYAAWNQLREDAISYYGTQPYTGSIKEKYTYKFATQEVLSIDEAYALANKLINEHPEFSDKWGPAGCIETHPAPDVKSRRFLFFGWASA
jgi:hypothetical protein